MSVCLYDMPGLFLRSYRIGHHIGISAMSQIFRNCEFIPRKLSSLLHKSTNIYTLSSSRSLSIYLVIYLSLLTVFFSAYHFLSPVFSDSPFTSLLTLPTCHLSLSFSFTSLYCIFFFFCIVAIFFMLALFWFSNISLSVFRRTLPSRD